MKKILILVTLLLFTGCTAEYNLKFNENSVEEKITIIPETSEEKENVRSLDGRQFYAIIDKDESLPYEITKIENDNYKSYAYKYEYNFNEFKKSDFTRCYDAFSLLEEDGKVTFSTSKKFNCMVYDYMKIDTVKINITTDYKVVENNADEVNGNVYTWKITNSNKENKPIKFIYNKKQKKNQITKESLEKYKVLIIVAATIVLSIGLIVLLIAIRHRRVNKI